MRLTQKFFELKNSKQGQGRVWQLQSFENTT